MLETSDAELEAWGAPGLWLCIRDTFLCINLHYNVGGRVTLQVLVSAAC